MKHNPSTTPLMLSAKSSISSNASFVTNNTDDPRPARLRLSYGMRRKGSNLTNNSSIERPRSHTGRQRCISGDNLPFGYDAHVDAFAHPVRDSIDDALENLDIELTEYEKLIMNKYLQEMQQPLCLSDIEYDEDQSASIKTTCIVSEPLCDDHLHAVTPTRFPLNDPIAYEPDHFPTKDQKYSFANSTTKCPSRDNLPSNTNSDRTSSSTATAMRPVQSSGASTDDVRNCRKANRNQPNHRNALRKNFSIWVGVTSCVWGLLLYMEKNYF